MCVIINCQWQIAFTFVRRLLEYVEKEGYPLLPYPLVLASDLEPDPPPDPF